MGIAAREQRNLPDPRPMSEAYGESIREVWLVRQGRRQQGGPTGNGRKQEITKRNDYQTAYPVPRPEQLHRNHHAGFLSSGPGETRREQQEVARFGRQSSARCGPSQSRDSRNVAFAKLTIVAHPAESGLEHFHTWCIGWSTASAVQLGFGNETALATEVTETLPQALKRDPRIDGSATDFSLYAGPIV